MTKIVMLSGFFVVALTSALDAQSAPSHFGSLSPEQVKNYDECVKQTMSEVQSGSKSVCSMLVKTGMNVGNTDTHTWNYEYQGLAQYKFLAGTGRVISKSGHCGYSINPVVKSDTLFVCSMYAQGCGIGGDGGFVSGACSVEIQYIPQKGDAAEAKAYCFAKVLGKVSPRPGTSSIDCTLP